MLDGYVANLHFDEAWLPHAAFHPFYGTYHAMGKKRQRPKESVVYATQSIHKLLAGISQASHVLVQDSQNEKLDHHLFNEAYLMHTSTSPQYSIIASCDVAAAMMEPPGGTALVEESILEALNFRRAMRKVDDEFGDDDWWFEVWGPRKAGGRGHWPGEQLDHPWQGCRAQDARAKKARRQGIDNWHGFGDLADGFNMLDPIKSTIVTPGSGSGWRLRRDRHPRLHRHQVPGRARRGGRKDGPLQLLHHVHHRHHQGPLEHAC